jgi:hypothetical protein
VTLLARWPRLKQRADHCRTEALFHRWPCAIELPSYRQIRIRLAATSTEDRAFLPAASI